MKYKILFIILAAIVAALSSCTKEDNNPAPSFEEIATSQLWVKSSWGEKSGTENPDDTIAPYENLMEPCDTSVLWSFKEGGVFDQYLSYECRDYHRGLTGGSCNWEYKQSENWLRFFSGGIYGSSYGYIVKQFSKDEIELYNIGDGIEGGGVSVQIIKLIPR